MKTKTRAALLGAALLAAALLGGCGASGGAAMQTNESAAYDMAPAGEPFTEDAAAAEGGALQSALQPQPDTDRKIIYNASVRLESKDFDGARDALQAAVDEYDAYVEYTDLSGSAEDGNRRLEYTARVPVEHYSDFIAAVGDAGSVLSLSESAEDITNNYIDVEARLDALKAQRDRLNELAAQAETTADLIEIEAQLSDVQYQLESYTRQLRSMDNSVQYSTVTITLREVTTYTPHNPSYLERITSAFGNGWQFFVDLLQDVSVAVVYLFPTLVLVTAIAFIVLFATRKRRAARKARAAAAKAARQAARNAPQAAPEAAPQAAPAPNDAAPPAQDGGPLYKR